MAELQEMPVYAKLKWTWNVYGIGLPHIGICLFVPLALMATCVIAEDFDVELPMLWSVLSFFPVAAFVAVAQFREEPDFLWRRMFKHSHRHFSPFAARNGMPPFPVPRSELERPR